jgi:predicted house-cleaning noncanonical NTP pyrophosphatase (MazG superfamily)
MKYFRFAKLVRDNILDHIQTDNQTPYGVRHLDDAELTKELAKKVREEADELVAAVETEELKKELADVQEILDHLKKSLKMTDKEVKKYQEQKIMKAGGFAKRIYIESVGLKDDDKWLSHYQAHPDKYPEISESETK